MKYRLMPYVYAEARDSSQRGLPMLRALFVEYPEDPGSWTVEDEYLFGSDILVAPLMEEGSTGRQVYAPPGAWIDYQTGRTYGGGWQWIEGGAVPAVVLVRDGAAIPHAALAQSTVQIDWTRLELVTYVAKARRARGLVCLPSEDLLREVSVDAGGRFLPSGNPLAGKVEWTVRRGAR
jgi:alpha-D-xyloside xylohydrolase